MFRLIAGMIGLFLFGVILAEVLNNFELFDFRVNVFFVALPLSLGFWFHESIIKKLEANLNSSPGDEIKYRKFIGIYYKILWLFGLIVLLGTPFLWWGAIMKLAKLANEGKLSF